MPTPAKHTIEIFRPGTHTTSGGTPLTFTAADVQRIADAYDPATAPAPVVIGHPEMDAPAFGWVARCAFDAGDQRLRSDLDQLAPEFTAMVAEGKFKRVSAAFFSPDHPANPKPGGYYLRHIGFLGAAAPAVTGLKPVTFGAGAGEILTIEFNAPAADGWAVSRLMRGLRDYFIDKFGLETADRVMPDYLVSSCEQSADPAFAATSQVPALTAKPAPLTEKIEMSATATDVAAMAAKDAEIARLSQENATIKQTAAKASATEFCAELITSGRLLPADRPALEAVLAGVDVTSAAQVEFATADGTTHKEAPGAVLRRVLRGTKPVIQFAEKTPPEGQQAPATFAAPKGDGITVDPAGAALHAKVKQYQAQHPGVEFGAALAIVQQNLAATAAS